MSFESKRLFSIGKHGCNLVGVATRYNWFFYVRSVQQRERSLRDRARSFWTRELTGVPTSARDTDWQVCRLALLIWRPYKQLLVGSLLFAMFLLQFFYCSIDQIISISILINSVYVHNGTQKEFGKRDRKYKASTHYHSVDQFHPIAHLIDRSHSWMHLWLTKNLQCRYILKMDLTFLSGK